MKPICFIDIESTGTDVVNDRIVQFAGAKFTDQFLVPDDSVDFICNPGQEMTPEVIAIHGITNEVAGAAMPFSEFAKDLHAWLANCDIAGFNVSNFDVPMLWEEFNHYGIDWVLSDTAIIDCGTLYKIREPRTLAAAAKFYVGKEHTEAHDAWGDVLMTAQVFAGQLAMYADLKPLIRSDLAKATQHEPRVDLAGKITLNAAGVPCFSFGKAKGKPVLEDRGFANWMLQRDFPKETKRHLMRILEEAA